MYPYFPETDWEYIKINKKNCCYSPQKALKFLAFVFINCKCLFITSRQTNTYPNSLGHRRTASAWFQKKGKADFFFFSNIFIDIKNRNLYYHQYYSRNINRNWVIHVHVHTVKSRYHLLSCAHFFEKKLKTNVAYRWVI